MRRVSLRFSLRSKILLAIVTLLAFLGGTVSVLVPFHLSNEMRREMEKRGVSIAHHISQSSTSAILASDPLSLRIAALSAKKAEKDILYVFFLGTHPGEVLAHTFGDTFPLALIEVNPLASGQEFAIRQLATEAGPVYDIAVPVARGGLGQVRLGLSGRPVEKAVGKLTREVLAITCVAMVIGIVLAIPLSSAIAFPVRRLTRAAEEAAHGHLDQEVPMRGGDELEQLARSFNHMLQEVRKAREALLAGNRELSAEVERRREAENQVASQLSFLSTLMNELPIPVFFKDAQRRYLGCNRALEEFLRKGREAIVGRTVFDLSPEEEAERHDRMDRELLAAGGVCHYEANFTRGDGELRQTLLHKAVFKDAGGAPAGLVGILLDVTEEREIDRLRNEFVSTVAHEFQTPLAAILGFGELLLQRPDTPLEERTEYLGIIQEKGEFLSRLVDQLLDVARLESGRGFSLARKPCHPGRFITRYLRSCRQNTSGREVQVLLPPECPPVLADEDRLIEVLDNLFSNAVKYSPQGSLIRIVGEVAGTSFHVSVENQGAGMAPEHLERIFEKFYRADTAETAPAGTGLGLYIARSIIEAHGGKIQAESSPGEWTRLTFSLPLAMDEAA